MSLRAQYGTDVAKEVNGVEVEYGQNADGSIPTFIISRMGKANKRYTKALERATKPYRRQIELNTMPEAQAEKLFLEVFVSTVVLGWRNVEMADVSGSDSDEGLAEFNVENAIALFTALPELYEDLQEKAKSASMFREAALEDEAKN